MQSQQYQITSGAPGSRLLLQDEQIASVGALLPLPSLTQEAIHASAEGLTVDLALLYLVAVHSDQPAAALQ
jgi:hypothetical protein